MRLPNAGCGELGSRDRHRCGGWAVPVVLAVLCVAGVATRSFGQAAAAGDAATAAATYRQGKPVAVQSDGLLVAEAEEFAVTPGSAGWQARNWGTNYYAATFANSFLSRKAYLGAPEQCDSSEATLTVTVPTAGKYLALVRYEACYRFETQFEVVVEQNGQPKLKRLYGARKNLKVWAFKEKLKAEVAWPWGAGENVVWEGHDAEVELAAGPATIRLRVGKQPEPAARRNVDLVLLTQAVDDVKNRIEKENYLPIDGLLTQADDVYVKLHNAPTTAKVTVTFPPCTEHSPYWVHLRTWKPKAIEVDSGKSTDWQEVGSLLDTLNDGQWNVKAVAAKPGGDINCRLEFGLRDASGAIQSLRSFEMKGPTLQLAYHGDTRYTKQLRLSADVLYDLLAHLKKHPVRGQLPQRTLIYGSTFDRRPDDPKFSAALEEFYDTFALSNKHDKSFATLPRATGYVDVRAKPMDEKQYKAWQADGSANKIAVVSLGDEIGLPNPPAKDHAAFHDWLKGQKLKPSDVDPSAGEDWMKIAYSAAPDTAARNPALFFYSHRYKHDYAIAKQKQVTDFVKQFLPHAQIGANFSPHHGHHYLGETFMWCTLFRRGGMVSPWSEDYIWQVPVGTQQVNSVSLDLFRAGLKGKPESKIHFYVMPHWGNTPDNWRRQFYGDLAHGMQIINLFEFRPVQAAYTENHADEPAMYVQIRDAFREYGLFEDIVQDGKVRPGTAALWFSETGDIWGDNKPPFGAAKRCLYIGIRHQQLPLDFVIDEDATDGTLDKYKVLYLADRHVSRAASQGIADWVKKGGFLFATAGAGLLDEFDQPNAILRTLLGVEQTKLEVTDPNLLFEKQDLPFSDPIDVVSGPYAPGNTQGQTPVIAARSRIKATTATVKATFSDGSPAITLSQPQGAKGGAFYCAFLPGLSYFKSAIPKKPWDRGSSADAMTHFLPTDFDPVASHILAVPIDDAQRPVWCAEKLVETNVIESKHGLAIPLINWTPKGIKDLQVKLRLPLGNRKPTLASGRPVKQMSEGPTTVFTFDLDVADTLILR